MPAMTDDFFHESTEQSQLKSAIVHEYFVQWSRVITGVQRLSSSPLKLAYIDLYAGPGSYNDGRPSTPLMILDSAIKDPTLSQSLISVFNDSNPDSVTSLRQAISELPDISKMKVPPVVHNKEVGQEIVDMLKAKKLIPTLLFLDPWGYKGLTLELLNAVLKDWGCDCIFFFNFNRINMGLANDLVIEHMDGLFGKERAERLRVELQLLKPLEKERRVLGAIEDALREAYGKFFLSFKFRFDIGPRTSHYLIFVTKNYKGYDIMKQIMAKHSSTNVHEVPSFEYNPPVVRHQLLLNLRDPIAELSQKLLSKYAEKTIAFKQLYESDNVGTPYIPKNYKRALLELEERGAIRMNPEKRQVRNGVKTIGDNVMISFPQMRNL